MNYSRLGLLFVSTMTAAFSMTLVLNAIVSGGRASAQAEERSLYIERHGNEPLEVVDLKISEHSIKSKIKPKFRTGDDGFDIVSFPNIEDWSKHIRVRLRNVSGKPIVGFQAYIYFKPAGAEMLFSASLKSAGRLEHTALASGEEIEATVDEDSWNRAVMRLRKYGGDTESAEISLSIGIVAFNDGLQWHKGHLLHRDPNNPNRHIPVEKKPPPGTGSLGSVGTYFSKCWIYNARRHA